jgi:hypothetical protein
MARLNSEILERLIVFVDNVIFTCKVLHIRRDSFFVLDHGLDIYNCRRRLRMHYDLLPTYRDDYNIKRTIH